MRSLIIAALVFLSFAPAALAVGYTQPGHSCTKNTECTAGYYCDFPSSLAVNKICLQTPNTSASQADQIPGQVPGLGATCASYKDCLSYGLVCSPSKMCVQPTTSCAYQGFCGAPGVVGSTCPKNQACTSIDQNTGCGVCPAINPIDSSAAAQTNPNDVGTGPAALTNPGVTLMNPLRATNLQAFLNDILDFVVQIGTIAIILMLVYVGYLFVVAQGSDTKITEARKALLWTVIGALILLGAKAIASALQATVSAIS